MLIYLMSFGFIGMAFAGESKYVQLYVFDAVTNGPVTENTSKINAFVDFVDTVDYIKNNANNLFVRFADNPPYCFVNDLQNNFGTIKQILPGTLTNAQGTNIGPYGGEISFYLGEYAITPPAHNFKGGVQIQFNFKTWYGQGTSAVVGYMNASKTIEFNK